MALLRSLGQEGQEGRERQDGQEGQDGMDGQDGKQIRADNADRMRCPACHAELSQVTLAGVTLDACQGGRGGIWFDRGELTFDPPAALLDEWLDELAAGRTVHVDPAERRHCPRCANSVLMRHFSTATRAVTIDECPTCAGIWLDNGELEQIRSEHVSAADRRRAVVRVFEERAIDDRMALISEELGLNAPFATWQSRVASGVIVALYLGFAAAGPANRLSRLFALTFPLVTGRYSSVPGPARIVGFCVLPLACIWFPEVLGSLVGARITKPSPRSFVWFLGWVVLLVPLIMVGILWIQGVNSSPFAE
jgi:uncharacterized protein